MGLFGAFSCCAPNALLAAVLACVAATGCWSDSDDGAPPASGIGATRSAVVASIATPSFVNRLELAGDTVALSGEDPATGRSSLHVSSIDPASGRPSPQRSLDVASGVAKLRVSDGFIAWLDPAADPATVRRLHVFDVRDLADTSASPVEWSPVDGSSLDVVDFDLWQGQLAWIGWTDDDRSVPPRLGISDLADDLGRNPIDLGAVSGSVPEVAIGERMVVWHGKNDALEVQLRTPPFDAGTNEDLGEAEDGPMQLRVSGRLAAWEHLGDLYVFDVERPVVAGVNPRNLGGRTLIGISAGYVLFSDLSGDVYYVLDATDPGSTEEIVYTERPGEDRAPTIGGPFVVWSICRNVETRTGIFFDYVVCTANPDVAVHVLDVTAPRVGGESPRVVGTGYGRVREVAIDPLGVAWRSGTGVDERLSFWNPGEPIAGATNPMTVYAGWPNAEALDLEPEGLAFFTENPGEVRQIRFIEAVELLLGTR